MAVRHMVHDLPDSPAARPIRRVKLLVREAGDGVAQAFGSGRNLSDCVFALSKSERRLVLVFPDRVTQIHLGSPLVEVDLQSRIRNLRKSRSRQNFHSFFNSSAAAAKNWSTIFRAAPSIIRWPTAAIIPPTCASPV